MPSPISRICFGTCMTSMAVGRIEKCTANLTELGPRVGSHGEGHLRPCDGRSKLPCTAASPMPLPVPPHPCRCIRHRETSLCTAIHHTSSPLTPVHSHRSSGGDKGSAAPQTLLAQPVLGRFYQRHENLFENLHTAHHLSMSLGALPWPPASTRLNLAEIASNHGLKYGILPPL